MKAKLLTKILLLSFLTFFFPGCNNDETKDWSEIVNLQVSSETGEYLPFEHAPEAEVLEGMKIKDEKENYWKVVHLNSIEGFSYEKGYEYTLTVEKTHLANPPADDSSIKYKRLEPKLNKYNFMYYV